MADILYGVFSNNTDPRMKIMNSLRGWAIYTNYVGLDGIIYIVLAVIVYNLIRRRTTKKLNHRLTIAFLILFPTWDFVLSSIIFYAACPFVPKAVIHETAETDGIYYEVRDREYVIKKNIGLINEFNTIHGADLDLKRGYSYMEVLVTQEVDRNTIAPQKMSTPIMYRCTPPPETPTSIQKNYGYQCNPVDDIRSRYLVKSESHDFLFLELNLLKIYDRSSNALMAEYRELVRYSFKSWVWAPVPFFNWLGWGWNMIRYGGASCPEDQQLFDYFQYDVLKVKKSP